MKISVKKIVATIAAVIALAGVAMPGTASAHALLVTSNPAPSSVIASSPPQFTLTFNEEIESTLSNIRLFDANQREIKIGKAERSVGDNTTAVASVPSLDTGVYIVVWRVVSADGHPVSGAFPFEIGTVSSGKAPQLLTDVLSGIDEQSPLGYPLAIARLLSFLGALVLIGMVTITWGSTLVRNARSVRVMRFSALALGVGSLGVLLLQGPYVSGNSYGQIFSASLIDDVLQTRLGVASLIRIAVAFEWLLITFFVAREGATLWKNTAIFTAFVTIATFSVSGHPSAAGNALVYMSVDAVHLAALSFWVGGITSLALLARVEDVTDELRRFSRIATYAMPIAVLSGVVQAAHLVPSINALTSSDYGRLLVAKVIVVLIAIALGTAARKKLHVDNVVSVRSHLRREAVLVLVVIALTSLLVGKSPTATASTPTSFAITMVQQSVVADFSITPTKVGQAEVHAIFTPPGGSLSPVKSVKIVVALASRNIPNIPVDLIEIGPNHWTGIVRFTFPGEWTLQARVSPQDNQTLLYSTTVKIAG